ncbi:AMP-binding enzyme [Yinghuangia aomiensis]
MIISSGYNIAGPEVEVALAKHPDVAECGVVRGARRAPRHDRQGVRRACREGVDPDDAKADELQTFVKDTVAPYKYPRAVEFVDALPRTSGSKLQRAVLRRWAAEGR